MPLYTVGFGEAVKSFFGWVDDALVYLWEQVNMKNYKYGKFRFDDYNISWFSIVCLFSFSVASAILDLSPLFIVFPALYAVFWLCTIFLPQFEYFVLHNDSITVVRCRKKRVISLPDEITLVVSYADICPPLAMRTTIGRIILV